MRSVLSLRRVVTGLILLSLLAAPGITHAGAGNSGGVSDGSGKAARPEPLAEFLTTTVQGGYAAAGASMRNLGRGKIGLWNAPPGSVARHAFLYWNLIGDAKPAPAYAEGRFNGSPITGELVAQGLTPCWGDPSAVRSYTYRAEVTKLLRPGIVGTYQLKDFASGRVDGAIPAAGDPLPYLEGATLVVIYENDRYPETTIFLYEGASMTSPETGPVLTRIMGVPDFDSYLAYTTYIIADGQTAPEVGAGFGASTVVAPVPQVDADGSDPVTRALGDYPGGNFWDTDRESSRIDSDDWGIPIGRTVGSIRADGERSVSLYGGIPSQGEVGDCLVHVAQVLSISDGDLNTDGDAFPDGWEANGFDEDGDGKIEVDLPALGANPFRKDLFLWMDYMPGHQPSDETMSDLVEVFNRGNVVNPDRRSGVSLHPRLGSELPYREFWVDTCGPWPAGSAPLDLLDDARRASLSPALRTIYHYQLWINWRCPGGKNGEANGIPGDAALVGTADLTSLRGQTHRSLHEFGHSLGLGHGGPGTLMSNAYAPNHLSVMSYLYHGVFYDGAHRQLDFQRMDLPALDEHCLDETAGLGSGDPILRDFRLVTWYFFDPASGSVRPGSVFEPGAGAGPIDWNQDGVLETCASVSIDEKFGAPDGTLEVLPAVLAEWPRLVYDGGDVGGPSAEGEPVGEE